MRCTENRPQRVQGTHLVRKLGVGVASKRQLGGAVSGFESASCPRSASQCSMDLRGHRTEPPILIPGGRTPVADQRHTLRSETPSASATLRQFIIHGHVVCECTNTLSVLFRGSDGDWHRSPSEGWGALMKRWGGPPAGEVVSGWKCRTARRQQAAWNAPSSTWPNGRLLSAATRTGPASPLHPRRSRIARSL